MLNIYNLISERTYKFYLFHRKFCQAVLQISSLDAIYISDDISWKVFIVEMGFLWDFYDFELKIKI